MCQQDGYLQSWAGGYEPSWAGGFSRTVYVIWHVCLDQNVLQTLDWTDVASPQGLVPVLFCFDLWAYVVDPGFDPLKEKKQTRSGVCRASRVHSRTRTGSLSEPLTPCLNPKMTLTKFMLHVTPRVSVLFFFNILSSTLFLYFIFTFFFNIWSSEPVQTDSTRSSLKPVFFFRRHFYFRWFFW